MSRVDTSLTQYITNHNSSANKLPVNNDHGSYYDATAEKRVGPPHGGYEYAEQFILQYMNSGSGDTVVNEFKDPDGTLYNMLIPPVFLTVALLLLYLARRRNLKMAKLLDPGQSIRILTNISST